MKMSLFSMSIIQLLATSTYQDQTFKMVQPRAGSLLALKKRITSHLAPAPIGPYSQAIQATSAQTLYISNVSPTDKSTGKIVGVNAVAAQTEQIMKNMGYVLKEAGLTFENVVKTTVYMTNLDDFNAMNKVYAKYFTDGVPPARSCIQISRLPNKQALVGIEAIAVKGL